MGNALVLALTYSEETEHSRRSARVFDYKDVQDFMKNLRRQVEYHFKRKAVVSFIAAGEQGDDNGRCHWHCIIFSEVDLTKLGKWFAPWGQVSDSREIITPDGVRPPWRRNWSLWRHGFVTVQQPDYGGMRYALAYALKDQFNVRNSAGTGREAKAEVFGTGYLVMSKKPPIGARWIDSYVEQCRADGIVPPSKRLTVDGLNRPFWPSGLLADRLLAGLASVNAEILDKTGKPGLGWSSLVHECRLSENDMEILGMIGHGEEEQEEEIADDKSAIFGLRIEDKHRWAAWRAARLAHSTKGRTNWERREGETLARYVERLEAAHA